MDCLFRLDQIVKILVMNFDSIKLTFLQLFDTLSIEIDSDDTAARFCKKSGQETKPQVNFNNTIAQLQIKCTGNTGEHFRVHKKVLDQPLLGVKNAGELGQFGFSRCLRRANCEEPPLTSYCETSS